jgi:hypothetical protein
MAEAHIWLDDWEHQCCGAFRQVGQDVALTVFRAKSGVCEQRHDYRGGAGDGPPSVTVRGQLTGIAWHPAIIERMGDGHSVKIVGYGPGIPCQSTDEQGDTSSWAFEFTVETDDELPTERWEPSSLG